MILPKSHDKSLENAADNIKVCSPSTPHRIKLPSEQEKVTPKGIKVSKTNANGNVLNPGQLPVRKPRGRPARNKGGRVCLSPKSVASDNTNHKLTEYFPVRRSVRKCKKEVLEEKQRDLENKIVDEVEEGLEVHLLRSANIRLSLKIQLFPGKGRGIITSREFKKGEFVVEYVGELIDQTTAKKRETMYAQDQNTGCYMYYFQHHNQQYCVDATAESTKLGRLVNHSRNGNLIARVVEIKSTPHLVLIAKEDISAGVEVSYDYGDRSRESIRNHPWLAL